MILKSKVLDNSASKDVGMKKLLFSIEKLGAEVIRRNKYAKD